MKNLHSFPFPNSFKNLETLQPPDMSICVSRPRSTLRRRRRDSYIHAINSSSTQSANISSHCRNTIAKHSPICSLHPRPRPPPRTFPISLLRAARCVRRRRRAAQTTRFGVKVAERNGAPPGGRRVT
jgi:hypothetical protein